MKTNFGNKEIAELLRSVAAAYTVKDEDKYKFRIIAYQRAADSIEHSSSEVKDLWDEGKLEELSGIGPSIASSLGELFSKGKVKHFNQVFTGLPPAMFSLLKIPGVGPKSAYKLAKVLKINKSDKAINLLGKAAKKGQIRKIEGFGEESEAKILKGIDEYSGRTERMSLYQANEIAQDILLYLEKNPLVAKADPLGSLRRKCSTVGDIDISVASENPEKVIAYFNKYPKKLRVLESGRTTASLLLKNDRQADLMIQPPEAYGALLQHFTGSKHHNIHLREIALKKGLSLSEYGIKLTKKIQNAKFKMQNYNSKLKIYEFNNEKSFYEALDLSYIAPEIREDTGEIEASLKKKLPKLIELTDIKGDLHLHSNFLIEPNHDLGENSFDEFVNKAISLKYEYLAFTEHNPSISRHTNNDIISLIKRKKESIDHLIYSGVKKLPVKVFNSLEIDIKPNGDLAIPEKAFEFMDFVIVSIHSSFDMDKDLMTKRILKGLSHPKAKIFAHPTGRKLNQREGYELDWEKIFAYCRDNHKFLEISAWPDRLDLPDFLVREAVKNEVKMVINTDSHAVEQMNLMPYGVSVAKRGWAEKKDIINTLSVKEISDILLK